MLWPSETYYFLPHKGWEYRASDVLALTTALYWEAALEEPPEGLSAILWTIENRKRSKNFPNTYLGVITQGAKPGRKHGCQFSFACDGEVEMPQVLCRIHKRPAEFCTKRWRKYYRLVMWWLYVDKGTDPTEGGVLYFTGKEPYWVKDMETKEKIGSHWFGRSKYLGRDIASLP